VSAEIGEQLGYWTLAPFVCMLLAVAVLPLVAGSWFHHNRNKGLIGLILGLPTVVYVLTRFGHLGLEVAAETAEEYVSFIILLFALYTISGGIYLTGNLIASPMTNLVFLAIGAVLANFIGTMGASMVLIRPLLRANSERRHTGHTVVFFVFTVSNLGGLLTPLGDPPLFLGFLRGVPFSWTLGLWPQWLLAIGLLLTVYMTLEVRQYRKEPAEVRFYDRADYVPMRLKGSVDILLLALVIVTILFSDRLMDLGETVHFPFLREVILVILAVISLKFAPRGPRAANSFCWAPIVEVAVIFAGIFATMIPALALLQAHGAGIGLSRPWHYFWSTGVLSAFLDNAPTYLAFGSIAQGHVGAATLGGLTSSQVVPGLGLSPAAYLAAISCGAVMMGALTYIGNAPNFTVKCIAERAGFKMPSFLGYMRYSFVVLIPIFAVVTAVFFI
jgi:Na+/H+ antiporter NhaD/arsenite permease-like protein